MAEVIAERSAWISSTDSNREPSARRRKNVSTVVVPLRNLVLGLRD